MVVGGLSSPQVAPPMAAWGVFSPHNYIDPRMIYIKKIKIITAFSCLLLIQYSVKYRDKTKTSNVQKQIKSNLKDGATGYSEHSE